MRGTADRIALTLFMVLSAMMLQAPAAAAGQDMRPQAPLRLQERENWDFFLKLPEYDRRKVKLGALRQQQVLRPLFEFSGACSGCGESPYIKMLTQLFGDRAVIANATGCTSIYGGNLPTTPYAQDANGHGPTWCNSLVEDRITLADQREDGARPSALDAPVCAPVTPSISGSITTSYGAPAGGVKCGGSAQTLSFALDGKGRSVEASASGEAESEAASLWRGPGPA